MGGGPSEERAAVVEVAVRAGAVVTCEKEERVLEDLPHPRGRRKTGANGAGAGGMGGDTGISLRRFSFRT